MRLLLTVGLALFVWVWPQAVGSEVLGFTLEETSDQIVSRLGAPAQVDDALPNYYSWHFKIGVRDEHESSYVLCFRRPEGELVSVTRNFDPEETVDSLFPAGSYAVHHWPSAQKPQFSVRVRSLDGDRVLLDMGGKEESPPVR